MASRIDHFYYHPRMMEYDFGPRHPLRPERLRRTIRILQELAGLEVIDPGLVSQADLERVHSTHYIDGIQMASSGDPLPFEFFYEFGVGTSDTPNFPGMYEASCAYVGGSAAAARAVVDGANLAFGIGGGLHHAQRAFASGFCVFNDCAVALSILRDRFERVAYVDIDVHHGDGVEMIFSRDPSVMTCSIHQMSPGFYPGTGSAQETGSQNTTVNVPLSDGTTGDTWLWAFREGIIDALHWFKPQAIVLQMGTDTHYLDPLAHIQNTAQEWLEAVQDIQALGVPLVALGGGGYNLSTVPRMWAAAVLTLSGIEVPQYLPSELASDWNMPMFFDPEVPMPRNQGREQAERDINFIRSARPLH
ncbi:MAG: acetoin utilization protein AcuC [Armatimonadetes bacterium]|nr:acetoin utilization protein AcuC [Armatimonadota bacterium]